MKGNSMNLFSPVGVAAILFTLLGSCALQAQDDPQVETKIETPAKVKTATDCKLPELRDELKKRVEVDQKARFALIESSKKSNGENQSSHADVVKKLLEIDRENTEWMKRQVKEHGWLGKTLVGTGGAHDAWLLVQHADRHRDFQKQCLELMNKMPKGEVVPIDVAYLTDRVRSAEGKPQLYGTQCSIENGKAVMKDVEDRENLNKRRAEIGLAPIEEYLKQVEAMYSKKKE